MKGWFRLDRFSLRKSNKLSGKRKRQCQARNRLMLELLEDRALPSNLTLSIAAQSIVENAGPAATTGTVTRVNTDISAPVVINLTSSDTSKAAVPATVTIPANQAAATFNIDAVDQDLVAGNETVTISAAGPAPLALDPNFGTGGSVAQFGNTYAMALQGDGKILTATGTGAFVVTRYNANGTVDTSFGSSGTATVDVTGHSSDVPQAIAIQADGKILVGGYGNTGSTTNSILARFNTDGTLDATFGNGGKVVSVLAGNSIFSEIWELAVLPDGHILAGGDAAYSIGLDFTVGRLNADGSLDTTFGTNGIAHVTPNNGGRAFGLAVQSNGAIVLAGEDSGGNASSEFALTRFTASGQLNTTFGSGGKVLTDIPGDYEEARDITIQQDGKLVVVGQVSPAGAFPPNYDIAMARYNTDGSLDSSFGSGGIAVTSVGGGAYSRMGVAIQSNGQILVSGSGTNGTKSGLLRYYADGTSDVANFTSSKGTAAVDVLIQPDGLILLTGASGQTNGFLERYVSKVNLTASATLVVQGDEATSPPVANNDSYTMSENGTLSVAAPGVLANDTTSDPDPLKPLTASLYRTPTYGFVTLNADGSFSYTPPVNFSGTDSFAYTASDGTFTSNVATVTITVVDQPPVAVNHSYSVNENQTLTVASPTTTTSLYINSQPGDYIGQGLTATFTPADGTFTVSRNFDNGVFIHFANSNPVTQDWQLDFAGPNNAVLTAGNYFGAIRYPFQGSLPGLDINANSRGCNTLKGDFTVIEAAYDSSGNVLSFDALFEQHCEGMLPALFGEIKYNAPPPIDGVLVGDSDPDSNPFWAKLVTGPTNGTLTLQTNGAFTYTPNIGFAGTDSFTYKANDGFLDSNVATVTITVNPPTGNRFAVAGFPSPSTAGVPGSFTVTVDDANGHVVTGYTGTVHFKSSDAQAVLPTDYTFTAADAGVHTFSATFKTAGTQAIAATDIATSPITGSQTGITVNSAAASSLVVSGFPSPTTAGVAGTVTVTAKDPYNNTATGYTGTVHFTSSDGQAVLPTDYAFTAGDAGVHSFGVTLKTAGSQSITATDTVTSTIAGSQTGITVQAAAASSLIVSGFPSPWPAGVAGGVIVTLKDPYGNVATGYRGTVHFTSSDPQAVLPADYTFTATDGGVHVFIATFEIAGSQSITVTDTVTSTLTGTETNILVKPANFVVSGFPSPTTAGVAHSFTVTAKNGNGTTATGYTGTVHFASTDAQALLPADYTFTSADAGGHTFSATLKTAGTQSLTVIDPAFSSVTGAETGITVNAAALSKLAVTGFPSPTVAGVAHSFTVTAQDAYGNTVTSYLGAVHFTSTDNNAVLPANYKFVAGDAGVHSFSATFNTPGSQSLTATDTAFSSVTGSQTGIIVNSATAASTLVVSGFPSPSTAGVAGSFTVTADDSGGHVVTGYTGTVHFTSSDPLAVVPADYTFTAADAGQHTFNATLKTADSQSLTATDTVTNTITGAQTGITVNPAAASSLVVSGFPSPTTAGVAGTVTVTAKDPFSNTATGYTGRVHFTSSDLQAALPGDYTFAAGDAGVHTFNATLKTAGSQSITATDTATSTITGSQTGITVNPAAASSLVVAGFPSPTTAGMAGTVAITAKDAYGNTATGYTGTVHFTSGDLQAALPANYTFAAADAGVHTFNATLKTAGSQSITATDTVTSTITGSQTGITVNPGAASSLVVSGFPSPVMSGQAQNFSVKALDPYGNTATGYTGKVHFTSTDGAAALPADYTYLGSDAGIHTFSAALETAGTQSLTATDSATASITGSEANILVKPANFVVSGFPSPTTAGVAHSFSVTAKNANGATATGYTGMVHFTSTDGQALLSADYTFTSADAGVHTFSATLKTAGSQSLTATDTVLTSVTGAESSITVNPAALSKLAVTGFPSPTVAGVVHSFTVTTQDAYSNTVTSYLGTVHFTSTDKNAVVPANYTFVAADAGLHSFSATLKTAGTQTITAKDTVKTTVTGSEAGILVNPAAASHFKVSAPTSSTAGAAFSITVTALDPYGNTATGYTGTVHFISSDNKAVLPADYSFTGADGGVHIFNNAVTLKTAGTQTVTATDTVTATITGKATIKVNAAAVDHLKVTALASSTAGTAFSITITAQDAFNNTVTSYLGTIHFTSTDAQAILPANYTFTSTDKGVHTFSNGATLKTAGTQSITATDTVTATVTGSASIKVAAAKASKLRISAPTSVTHGVPFTFTVTVLDAFGNVATGYTGMVHFSSSDAAASLPANYKFTSANAGVHTFSATLNTTGSQLLTATDTVTSSITGSDLGIQVT